MLKIYDQTSSVTWPDGTEMRADEMRSHPVYKRMFEEVYVIDVDTIGITNSFFSLRSIVEQLGIEETDPEKALAAAIARMEAMEREAEDRARVFEEFVEHAPQMGENVATTQNAVAELGTLAATSMQSTAELGATVAALEERVKQLEAAAQA